MTHYSDDNNEYDQEQARFETPYVRYWNGRYWAYSYPRDPDYAQRMEQVFDEGFNDE